jgi:DNA mismatch repair protein MutS
MAGTTTSTKTGSGKPTRDTPAMRQYARFKERHPGCVLLFRMGDFYEMFDEDAVAVSKAIGLTLTQRSEGVPMAGVPHHSVDSYIAKMLKQGFRVAICDQIQDPKEAKGIVDRAVTRVLSPGALSDESLLSEDAHNRLVAVAFHEEHALLAVVEVSTGEFTLRRARVAALGDEMARLGAVEALYVDDDSGDAPESLRRLADALNLVLTARPGWHFAVDEGERTLKEHFSVATLRGFGLREDDALLSPAGAVVKYLYETQAPDKDERRRAESLSHLRAPRVLSDEQHLVVDAVSLRSLEIERTIRAGESEGSLLGVFSRHGGRRTPMGRRLLRDWLRRPLAEIRAIGARQKRVATLTEDRTLASELQERIDEVQDIARIGGRLGLGRATPRDVVALGRSLTQIRPVAALLENAPAFTDDRASLLALAEQLAPLAERIGEECVDDPPAHLREGGLFREGVDAELDEAKGLQKDASSWLAKYQAELVAQHELPNLKVGFNRVFGYYIELPSAQSKRAPATFTRKQTLKNAERYITPELKDFEDKVTTAEARAIEREQALFADLTAACAGCVARIGQASDLLAALDVLLCFAQTAVKRSWSKPEITPDATLSIVNGRHPVLDDLLGEEFVPNDCELGSSQRPARLALITGPNMAGKSTYIRQAALLTLLAHTGSFIPAETATIGLTDRIFTRVGADDALHAGQSTFMVEMTETAAILHSATERSLVILDEIGRGTSTLDGLALAWAIAETLAGAGKAGGPRTLFATHYHELTTLEDDLPGKVANLQVAVREWGDEIVFLHRIQPGRTDQSYGIHVARLAGLPERTIARARDLLKSLAVSHEGAGRSTGGARTNAADQMSLFTEYVQHPVVDRLREVKLEALSPLEAFDLLRELRESAGD